MNNQGSQREPITIFIIHPSDFLTDHRANGDGLIAFGFIKHLAERGQRIHIAVRDMDVRQPLPENVHIYKIPRRVKVKLLDRVEYMIRVRLLFEQLRKTETIHVLHQMNPVFAGLSLAFWRSNVPLVLGTIVPQWPNDQDAVSSRFPLMNRALKIARRAVLFLQQRQASALLLTSPAAINKVPSAARIQRKIHSLSHGIDSEIFCPVSSLSSEPENPTILFLAGLLKKKGVYVLLAAFAEVVNRVPNCRLLIAGSGPEAEPLAQDIASRGLTASVELLGSIERGEIPDLLRRCNVYCLPSFGEPFATTIIEAMSSGRAIVATNGGGLPYLVPEGGGLLVPTGDSAALASALTTVLTDQELQRSMGRINRAYVENHLRWNIVVDKLECIYETLLKPVPSFPPRRRAAEQAEPTSSAC